VPDDDVSPLYVDGPLQGKDHPIERNRLTYGLVYHVANGTYEGNVQTFSYHFHPFTLLGHAIWLGSLLTNLQAVPMEVIVSERAKQAM
jgi:hypothetical protein